MFKDALQRVMIFPLIPVMGTTFLSKVFVMHMKYLSSYMVKKRFLQQCSPGV